MRSEAAIDHVLEVTILYRGQVVSGASYQELHRVITINLIDFVQFPSTDRYHTSDHVVEDQTHERLSDA